MRERIEEAVGEPRMPWAHGLWVSAREHFERVPLPTGFRLESLVLAGERRRLARCDGEGRTVVVLPGLYADLHEKLFVDIAGLLAMAGRPVILLEDRLATETVRLAGSPRSGLSSLGGALDALIADLPHDPDVLALSAGLLSAWTASAPMHRVVGFSGLRAPASAVRSVRDNPVIWAYFEKLHRESGLSFSMSRLLEHFASSPTLEPPQGDWLLVHAEDDPVVPVESLDDLLGERVIRVSAGGHLGFGVLAGPQIYTWPLLEPC